MYTGHDEDCSGWFNMKGWRGFSSTDMANWTNLGSPMNLSTFSWASYLRNLNVKFFKMVEILNKKQKK